MLIVLFLSRTGRFETAQTLSAATLGLLIVLVASESGGMASFALAWGSVLLTNCQVDGLGGDGSVTAYLDNVTVYRW